MEVAKIVKKNVIVLLASIVVTLVLPFVAIKLLPLDADMIVIMTLLWIVNTVAAGGIGFYSGLSIKTCWFQPLIFVGLFALSAFVVWQGGTQLLLYGIVYLFIGYLALAITALVRSKRLRQINQ